MADDDYKFFKVETEGFKELEDVLMEMARDIGYKKTASKVLVPAAKNAMIPVARYMRASAPYDETNHTTPHLRDSVRISGRIPSLKDLRSRFVDKDEAAMGIVSVRSDKRAISQEFGNARTAAQPYLRSSLESQYQNVIQILGSHLAYKLAQYKSKKNG